MESEFFMRIKPTPFHRIYIAQAANPALKVLEALRVPMPDLRTAAAHARGVAQREGRWSKIPEPHQKIISHYADDAPSNRAEKVAAGLSSGRTLDHVLTDKDLSVGSTPEITDGQVDELIHAYTSGATEAGRGSGDISATLKRARIARKKSLQAAVDILNGELENLVAERPALPKPRTETRGHFTISRHS